MKWALVAFSVIASGCGGGRSTRFAFEVPAGWTDFSPDCPSYGLKKIDFCAADVDSNGLRLATMAAIVGKGVPLEPFSPDLQGNLPGSTVAVTNGGFPDWGDNSVYRVAYTESRDGARFSRVVFSLTGDDEHGLLTFTTTPPRLAAYGAVFDETARRTRGIGPRGLGELLAFRWWLVALVVALGGAAGLVVARSVRARRVRSRAALSDGLRLRRRAPAPGDGLRLPATGSGVGLRLPTPMSGSGLSSRTHACEGGHAPPELTDSDQYQLSRPRRAPIA